VLLLSALVEFVMLMRVSMIWSENKFWYMNNQGGWLFLITTYQVIACIIPMFCFMVIVVG
jgi:hypothetical protein